MASVLSDKKEGLRDRILRDLAALELDVQRVKDLVEDNDGYLNTLGEFQHVSVIDCKIATLAMLRMLTNDS